LGRKKKQKKKHDEDHGGGKDERSLPRAVMERRTQPIMTGSLQQASGSRPFRPLHSSAFTHAHSTSLFPSLSVPSLAHVSHRWRIRRRHQNKNQGRDEKTNKNKENKIDNVVRFFAIVEMALFPAKCYFYICLIKFLHVSYRFHRYAMM
jgi:hypothetical protein